jgi:glutamate synthase domain-containing protein 2/glutamate synthase domain-containing protein 1/glutamate synthase domain-containing protein 3
VKKTTKINPVRCNAAGMPKSRGLYDPEFEHDACGVGFLARLDGTAEHSVVEDGIQILKNLEHRGAVGGDKDTGDGAGLLVRIPDRFFRGQARRLGRRLPPPGDYAVGMIFLPVDGRVARRCERTLEKIAKAEGAKVLGWRDVPVNSEAIGELARSTQPRIRQIFLARKNIPAEDFERKLLMIRRQAEKSFGEWSNDDTSQFYIASLSSRTIVYKGLLAASQISDFFPDLTDERFASPYALVHQRFSTNTWPTWALAQPFRMVAHNGEINTLRGNRNQMKAREPGLVSEMFGEELPKVLPILIDGGSDSAIFDNMTEFLVMAGRPMPLAMMMLVPEAWGPKFIMSADKRAFYEYHSAVIEPWDGPAAMMFCDDDYIGATLDRNGLRPARYTITTDGRIVMASETGALDIPPEMIRHRGHLQPGKMFLVDLNAGRVVPDHEIKSKISRFRPYRLWLKSSTVDQKRLFQPITAPRLPVNKLLRIQHAYGYTEEEMRMVLAPMAETAQEPIGSMGNDAALAVLSDRPQLLFAYFKQLFAQVTNPPIDPLREELVMSLMGWIGADPNLLAEKPADAKRLKLNHPILTLDDLNQLRQVQLAGLQAADIDTLFDANGGDGALETAMTSICAEAEREIESGSRLLILTDWNLSAKRAPIPSLLAVAGIHNHLMRIGKRNLVGLIVETGEAREVAHFALLAGQGANAICPYGAMASIAELVEDGTIRREDLDPDHAVDHYVTAIRKGLLKTFSRMGISTLRSYIGAQIFEAIGLDPEFVDRYFTGTPSRIGGIGTDQVQTETLIRHRRAFPESGSVPKLLDVGGDYHLRVGGERHLWSADAIWKLQHAVRTENRDAYRQYARLIDDQSRSRATLRSLFKFNKDKSIALSKVEPAESIMKRFVTAAMSYGSISSEAHESIAIAMNRIGGRSNSGEGGEDPVRFKPMPNGDSKRSAIKQVASGRFGVTTEYLLNADEIQIKIAQGAKPGEGGQLPGHKVTAEIARVRHTKKGVTLISPPPHHDIYSIEDLAQLIHDLKCVNPSAYISVKLVSEVGVGTVAAGVAKAQADLVLISGHDGGTGASPLTSIKHVGTPWELGLSETQQALTANQLRGKVRVQVDGQLKTGRDLAVAALMGAEEFGFGTTILVALGCVMMRKCHSDTCPVGVATQDPKLRERFMGKPEHVVNFLRFIAEDLREHMAKLGFATVDQMVGRVDRLETETAVNHFKAKGLDLSALLHHEPVSEKNGRHCAGSCFTPIQTPLDDELITEAEPALSAKTPVVIQRLVNNVHRAVGARLSGELVRRHGAEGLPDETIRVELTGSAGQSFGAFLSPGITIDLRGDANDYVAKGMSGGRIVIAPHENSKFPPHENSIVGNTALYGATGGEVYLSGVGGMRFAVRNSGATAVVEGVGRHGCEYMTGGTVVVLGPTGYNFAAGMSGGLAYVFDETELFDTRCNLDMVELETVWTEPDKKRLHKLVKNHHRYTGSPRAKWMLENWESLVPLFVKVVPLEYKQALRRMQLEEQLREDSVSATEEVFE